MKKLKINRERIFLTTLVAVSFFGFLLWSIDQTQSETSKVFNLTITPTPKIDVIKVNSLKANDAIKSPLILNGTAKDTGERIRVRIKDKNGLVLAEKFTTVKTQNGQSDFSATLSFRKSSTSTGTIEVFRVDKDQQEKNKTIIPIKFQ